MTIIDALHDPQLFGGLPGFRDLRSWAAWLTWLRTVFALPFTEADLACYCRHAGREQPPATPPREVYTICGRRAGKSFLSALVAVYLATFRDYVPLLGPGEQGTLPVIAADRAQARTVFRYISGLLDEVPLLTRMVDRRTTHSIALTNRITIEVHTASFRTIRGYAVISAVCDELAFWRSEDSANPDVEILSALRPGMLSIPDAVLLCLSSPYSRRGALWDAYRRHYGQQQDSVLVWQAPTQAMNPTVNEERIAQAYADDEAMAASEYGAEFRRDIEALLPREAVDAVVVAGRRELPPAGDVSYAAFVDPSGGSQDSMTLAIAHKLKDCVVIDAIRERRPPFSPDAVVAEFASLLHQYHVTTVRGDRYGGEWPREQFQKHGVSYDVCSTPKSELYTALVPLINSGRIELPHEPRLVAQLSGLERRTVRSGRDSIDHGPGAHDDLANAVAGVAARVPKGSNFLAFSV